MFKYLLVLGLTCLLASCKLVSIFPSIRNITNPIIIPDLSQIESTEVPKEHICNNLIQLSYQESFAPIDLNNAIYRRDVNMVKHFLQKNPNEVKKINPYLAFSQSTKNYMELYYPSMLKDLNIFELCFEKMNVDNIRAIFKLISEYTTKDERIKYLNPYLADSSNPRNISQYKIPIIELLKSNQNNSTYTNKDYLFTIIEELIRYGTKKELLLNKNSLLMPANGIVDIMCPIDNPFNLLLDYIRNNSNNYVLITKIINLLLKTDKDNDKLTPKQVMFLPERLHSFFPKKSHRQLSYILKCFEGDPTCQKIIEMHQTRGCLTLKKQKLTLH